jgi:ATP-dependent Lhr-like helicase
VHDVFSPAVQAWFNGTFPELMGPQQLGWPAIARSDSTLDPAPTGPGKTLTLL